MLTSSPGAFDLHDLTTSLLVGSLVLVVAVAAVRLSLRSGLPSLLLYLGIGVILGEDGLGLRFDDAALTQVLGYAALILILAEGGLGTRWSAIRPSVLPALALSTVGVVVSVGVVAAACHLLLGMAWPTSLLVGAILASTDAAAVFSVLRQVPLPRRVTGMLEAEAGFNDAPVVILVTALAAAQVDGGRISWGGLVATAMLELALGAVVGVAVGFAGGWLMRRLASGSTGLFAIGVMSVIVLAYAAAASVHASGFIACYLAALVLGNQDLPHHSSVLGFAQALGWLAQIGLFVLLGLLASPRGMVDQLVPALVIGTVLLLAARPASVLLSLAPFRIPVRTLAFLSWAGLRGAVPVVLATVPITQGSQAASSIFELVFLLVVIFTLVQAPTLPWVAQRLGVVDEGVGRGLDVDATPLDELGASILEVRVGEHSRMHGVEVDELRLPRDANVTLVVRDGHSLVPGPQTILRHGDQLLVVTPNAVRDATQDRLRLVSQEGRLAGW